MSNEAIVTIPPDVVRILASSTVFVKASKRVNLDLAGMVEMLSRALGDERRIAENAAQEKANGKEPRRKIQTAERTGGMRADEKNES